MRFLRGFPIPALLSVAPFLSYPPRLCFPVCHLSAAAEHSVGALVSVVGPLVPLVRGGVRLCARGRGATRCTGSALSLSPQPPFSGPCFLTRGREVPDPRRESRKCARALCRKRGCCAASRTGGAEEDILRKWLLWTRRPPFSLFRRCRPPDPLPAPRARATGDAFDDVNGATILTQFQRLGLFKKHSRCDAGAVRGGESM